MIWPLMQSTAIKYLPAFDWSFAYKMCFVEFSVFHGYMSYKDSFPFILVLQILFLDKVVNSKTEKLYMYIYVYHTLMYMV